MILAALERNSGISSEEPDSYLRQKLHYSSDASGMHGPLPTSCLGAPV